MVLFLTGHWHSTFETVISSNLIAVVSGGGGGWTYGTGFYRYIISTDGSVQRI
eukprot:Pgem_evm2s4085